MPPPPPADMSQATVFHYGRGRPTITLNVNEIRKWVHALSDRPLFDKAHLMQMYPGEDDEKKDRKRIIQALYKSFGWKVTTICLLRQRESTFVGYGEKG
jgi:hypothetical protein